MFKKVFLFYLSYLVALTYSQTLLMLWFLTNGVSYLQMLFYFLVLYVSVLVTFFLLRNINFSSKFALVFGVTTSALGVLVANFMTQPAHIFITAILFGFNIVFFWTIYNSLHFKYSQSNENGYKSGAYFLFMPIFSAVLAPLAGFVATKLGYHFLFLSGIVLYILPFYFAFHMPKFDFKFNFINSARNMENKLLIAFQGYNEMLSYNIVPIFTLFFINTPGKLGNFFGYLAILSAVTAFLNSKISDKFKNRKLFFYLFISLHSLSYIPLALVNSLAGWRIFAGISNFTFGLANPFNLALAVDHAKGETVDTMLGREIYLNSGRVVMILVALTVFFFSHSLKVALLLSVLASLLYPVVAYFKKVYLK
ncbi:MAG: hypothetical protein V4439_01065 [Patescibacteria group bacterium]